MKKRRRLIWQLYPAYLALVLLSLLAASGYAYRSMDHFFKDRMREDLKSQAVMLAEKLAPRLPGDTPEQVDPLCKEAGGAGQTRFTVIQPDGRVIGDSNETPRFMDNHAGRPEIAAALQGRTGTAIRYSNTLRKNMMYLALPVVENGRILRVVRTSIPMTALENELRSLQIKIGGSGILIALLASGVCLYISRRISRPIEEITTGANRFARGDLQHRLKYPDTLELASLSRALNKMAEELESRVNTVLNQRNEYEAVLSSMTEGVIAIDMEECILSINQAAARMLEIQSLRLKGRSIFEAFRNRTLHAFIEEALATGTTMTRDILVHQQEDQVLHAQCIPLKNIDKHRIGTLLVLNDVTRIRKLENVRKDFVANVSHEIKTPLTAIKGFVETLQSGSAETHEERKRFLDIVAKHANRLGAIVEDLLLLARLEEHEDTAGLQHAPASLENIVSTAVEVVRCKADRKQVPIEVSVPRGLTVDVDATSIEQAIINLLDNAVKYSPSGAPVRVVAAESETECLISVSDKGPGIARNHLPRLFERFYRVDKARSRVLGGTGLGLSIVKHIVQVHGGTVSVDSTIGSGSTFTLHLPRHA